MLRSQRHGSQTKMLKNRVLVIALDGVTFKVIRPLAEEGHLPNLSKLMSEGSSGELLSTMPPVSGPAWHAFKTGKSPGQTGLYDFLRYDLRITGAHSSSLASCLMRWCGILSVSIVAVVLEFMISLPPILLQRSTALWSPGFPCQRMLLITCTLGS